MSFTNSNGSGSTSCCTSMLIILFCIGIIGGSLSIRRLIEYNKKISYKVHALLLTVVKVINVNVC